MTLRGPKSLTLEDISLRLDRSEPFEALIDGVAHVRVRSEAPFLCVAVHDGHDFRRSLGPRCLLSEGERHFEEDPFTGDLIEAMPLSVVALSSRYECDLNRDLPECVYLEEAWGKRVWDGPLPEGLIEASREKHSIFYALIDLLVRRTEARYGACLVFDMHTYNHQRWGEDPPTFNIGTSQLDVPRFGPVLEDLEARLERIELPGLDIRVARDDVFQGMGYLAMHLNGGYENTLSIPLETAKVFMDAERGELYPEVFSALRDELDVAIRATAELFARRYGRTNPSRI